MTCPVCSEDHPVKGAPATIPLLVCPRLLPGHWRVVTEEDGAPVRVGIVASEGWERASRMLGLNS